MVVSAAGENASIGNAKNPLESCRDVPFGAGIGPTVALRGAIGRPRRISRTLRMPSALSLFSSGAT
jgi:hypothetical protein